MHHWRWLTIADRDKSAMSSMCAPLEVANDVVEVDRRARMGRSVWSLAVVGEARPERPSSSYVPLLQVHPW